MDDYTRKQSIQLFEFLRELSALRSKAIYSLDKYEKVLWFNDIPKEKECHCISWAPTSDEERTKIWIQIKNPELKPVPELPEKLVEWINLEDLISSSLLPDCPHLKQTIAVKVNDDKTEVKSLQDDSTIALTWENYLKKKWIPWAQEDKRLRRIKEVYSQLFSIYQKQQKLGEDYEVIVGLGLLTWKAKSGQSIKRHLLVAQTELKFVIEKGIIVVGPPPEGAKPRFEEEMLSLNERPIAGDQERIKSIFDEMGDQLWDKTYVPEVFTSWLNAVSTNGVYTDSLEPLPRPLEHPCISLAPALILRKRTEKCFVKAFDEIKEQLKEEDVPKGISRLINIETSKQKEEKAVYDSNITQRIYFPLPANDQQTKIIDDLAHSDGVVVQGPPGTGKSHTIVNLICHLLAEGKKILVTSHTARALKVLKEKLDKDIPDISKLCVNLLGEGTEALKSLEASVHSITDKFQNWNPKSTIKDIENFEHSLDIEKRKEAQIFQELRKIREKETFEYPEVLGRYRGTAQSIALELFEEKNLYNWLSDSPSPEKKPPITNEECIELLRILRVIGDKAEEANQTLIPIDKIFSVEILQDLATKEKYYEQLIEQHKNFYLNRDLLTEDILIPPDLFEDYVNSEIKAKEFLERSQQYSLERDFIGEAQIILPNLARTIFDEYRNAKRVLDSLTTWELEKEILANEEIIEPDLFSKTVDIISQSTENIKKARELEAEKHIAPLSELSEPQQIINLFIDEKSILQELDILTNLKLAKNLIPIDSILVPFKFRELVERLQFLRASIDELQKLEVDKDLINPDALPIPTVLENILKIREQAKIERSLLTEQIEYPHWNQLFKLNTSEIAVLKEHIEEILVQQHNFQNTSITWVNTFINKIFSESYGIVDELINVTKTQLNEIGERYNGLSKRYNFITEDNIVKIKRDANSLLRYMKSGGKLGILQEIFQKDIKQAKYLIQEGYNSIESLTEISNWIDIYEHLNILKQYWAPYLVIPDAPFSIQIREYKDTLNILYSISDFRTSIDKVTAIFHQKRLLKPDFSKLKEMKSIIDCLHLIDKINAQDEIINKANETIKQHRSRICECANNQNSHPLNKQILDSIDLEDIVKYDNFYSLIKNLTDAKISYIKMSEEDKKINQIIQELQESVSNFLSSCISHDEVNCLFEAIQAKSIKDYENSYNNILHLTNKKSEWIKSQQNLGIVSNKISSTLEKLNQNIDSPNSHPMNQVLKNSIINRNIEEYINAYESLHKINYYRDKLENFEESLKNSQDILLDLETRISDFSLSHNIHPILNEIRESIQNRDKVKYRFAYEKITKILELQNDWATSKLIYCSRNAEVQKYTELLRAFVESSNAHPIYDKLLKSVQGTNSQDYNQAYQQLKELFKLKASWVQSHENINFVKNVLSKYYSKLKSSNTSNTNSHPSTGEIFLAVNDRNIDNYCKCYNEIKKLRHLQSEHFTWRTIIDEVRRQFNAQLNISRSYTSKPNSHRINFDIFQYIESRDIKNYSIALEKLKCLHELHKNNEQKNAIIRKLESTAEKFAQDITSDYLNPAWVERVKNFEEAWNWRRTLNWVSQLTDSSTEKRLARELSITRQKIREYLGKLAAAKSWHTCLSKMTDYEIQHFKGWKKAVERYGKGTGKYANKHRKDAQSHLTECRSAIPVWIMPLYRVVESFEAVPEVFDVVIIDEASQSGPEAIYLMYIGKKIVVVGDDKQISPDFIGIKRDTVNELIEQYIPNFPQKDSLGLDNSFFDIAQIYFSNTVTLTEHFRCMPEIIQFSNKHFYSSQPLLPLRQYGAERLSPSVITYQVKDGYNEGQTGKKVNPPEANCIVAAIKKICKDERYRNKSIGIISLLGKAQASLIEQLLIQHIGPEEIEARQILCGDPYAFQGDERDIVFLSLVTSSQESKGRSLISSKAEKRFNVATSRAKDQIWLFHSIVLHDVPNPDCLRHKLLEYYLNPEIESTPAFEKVGDNTISELKHLSQVSNKRLESPPSPFDSWFEIDVFLRVIDKGYRVIPQYKIAGYYIDLVVEGLQEKLAIECDGDKWHGAEEYQRDMARQRMLERCGWKFWRVRGSLFYKDPDAALESLWTELETVGIKPFNSLTPQTEDRVSIVIEDLNENFKPVDIQSILKNIDVNPDEDEESNEVTINSAENTIRVLVEHSDTLNPKQLEPFTEPVSTKLQKQNKNIIKSSEKSITENRIYNRLNNKRKKSKLQLDTLFPEFEDSSFEIAQDIKQNKRIQDILNHPAFPRQEAKETQHNAKTSKSKNKAQPKKDINSKQDKTKVKKDIPSDIIIDDEGLSLIKWAETIEAEIWFSMAKWSKENNFLEGWERKLLFSIGRIAKQKRTITYKQARQCKRLYSFLYENGFINNQK